MGFFDGGMLTDIMSTAADFTTDLLNFRQQKKQHQYERYVTENATQIRAADLEAAGLSKTLAAGGGATSQVTGAPQMPGRMLEHTTQIRENKKINAETELTEAAKDKMKADARTANIEADFRSGMLSEQMREKYLQNDLNRALMDVNIETGRSAAASARIKVNTDYYNYLAAELAPDLARANLNSIQKDAYLKKVTAGVQEVTAKQKKHDYQWFKTHQVPSTIGFDPITRALALAVGTAKEQLQKTEAMEKLPPGAYLGWKPSKKQGPGQGWHGRGGAKPSDYNRPPGFNRTQPKSRGTGYR